MSSTPQFNTGQLQAARAKAWHQAGEPVRTLEAAREWLGHVGLLLFAPRMQHIAAPAPSLVEATLGTPNDAPTAAQTETARSLVARLVSEGNALPLNLLGGPGSNVGDMPDFVVSAQVFSFIFTLRGDKLWKQPPATSGTVKVTPLALGVYELLADRGATTAGDLAAELGREVTEAAVLRALNELWTHLRVIPLLQQGDAPTMWELTSKRFSKTIKAGANAGQPTALSALVSLYLTQALLATEEEVAAFLSPLAARSRIREVVHGLNAARQLEPVVLEGKTLLHIPGTLPEFPAAELPAPAEENVAEGGEEPASEERIKRFSASPDRRARSEFKGRPARSVGSGERRPTRPPAGRDERERRPFRRDASAGAGERSNFTRPWDEERRPKRERPEQAEDSTAPERSYQRRERPAAGGYGRREGYAKREGFTKRPFTRREDGPGQGADRNQERGPNRGQSRDTDRGPVRRNFGDKPPFRKDRGEGFAARPRSAEDGERKPYTRRESSGRSGDFSARPRRDFSGGEGTRPRFERGDRKPGGFAPKRPFTRREDGDTSERPRTPRPAFDRGDRGDRGADWKPGGFGPKRPYARRDATQGGDRPSFSDRRPAGGSRRPAGDRPAGRPFGERRSFRDGGDRSTGGGFERRSEGAGRNSAGRAANNGEGAPRRSFGGKPTGGGFSKRPGGRASSGSRQGFGAKPGSGAGRGSGAKPGFRTKPGFGQRPAGGGGRAPRKPRPESEE